MGAVWSVADPPIFAVSERIILSIRVKAGSMMPRTASFSVGSVTLNYMESRRSSLCYNTHSKALVVDKHPRA